MTRAPVQPIFAAMPIRLVPHPSTPCPAVHAIEVTASRPFASMLGLAFVLTGDLAALALPASGPAQRTDELWKHTCFEAFLKGPGEAYAEFNMAPSTRWAAYGFSSYRAGMAPLPLAYTPAFTLHPAPGRCELRVLFDLTGIPEAPEDAPWRLALSTVIETKAGAISYWAMRHGPEKPDFHHSDGFALELVAPTPA